MTQDKFQQAIMGPWQDAQKKMMEFWQDGMAAMQSGKGGSMQDAVAEGMKMTADAFKKWAEFAGDMATKGFSAFGDGSYQDMLNKMISSANVYQSLNKFWEDLQSKMTGKDVDVAKFFEDWKGEYTKMVSNNFIPYMPEQMQTIFKDMLEVQAMQEEAGKKMMEPWKENMTKMQDLLKKAMTGDKSAYTDFTKMWNEKFGDAFGKMMELPEVGMTQDYMEKQMESLGAVKDLLENMSGFVSSMVKTNQGTMEEVVKNYQKTVSEGKQPKTFKEFYKYWWTENEAAYQKLFKSTDYSKMVGQLTDAGLNVKKQLDSLMEKQFEFMPFPTKSDMDELYKTIADLRKELKASQKAAAK